MVAYDTQYSGRVRVMKISEREADEAADPETLLAENFIGKNALTMEKLQNQTAKKGNSN